MAKRHRLSGVENGIDFLWINLNTQVEKIRSKIWFFEHKSLIYHYWFVV